MLTDGEVPIVMRTRSAINAISLRPGRPFDAILAAGGLTSREAIFGGH